MKKIVILVGLMTYFSLPVLADSAAISVNIGQPGFYGQIYLPNQHSTPQLVYPNPVTAIPSAIGISQQPIYLHVPPGHAKKWSKHCHRYKACSQPTYFVQEKWYSDVYRTQYHNHSSYSDGHTAKNHRHSQPPSNTHNEYANQKYLTRNNHNRHGKQAQKTHHSNKHEKGNSKNR
ncbi:MAG: hypothetical protein WAU15_04395 [Nitrosomonas sp.]